MRIRHHLMRQGLLGFLLRRAADGGVLTVLAAGIATCGTAIAMGACGGGGGSPGNNTQPDSGKTTVPTPPPVLTGVAVQGSTKGEVRQGYGETTIEITGQFLDSATKVSVGPLEGIINGTTPTSATFTLAVPHGAPIGLQPVNITTSGGTTYLPNGVTITPITASPLASGVAADAGPDAGSAGAPDAGSQSALGTDESPFGSMAKALSVASQGDTVFLKAGTYTQATTGDTFAPDNGSYGHPPPNVPEGVTVKGETGTMLVGDINSYGLVPVGDAQIANLDISRFHHGIVATSGTVTLSYLTVHNNTYGGIMLDGTPNVALNNVEIAANQGYGITIIDSAAMTLTNSHVHNSEMDGIHSQSTGPLILTNTEIDNNYSNGIYLDLFGTPAATGSPTGLTVTGGPIHDNGVGIQLTRATGAPRPVTVAGVTFNNKGDLAIDGAWAVKVRGSQFSGFNTLSSMVSIGESGTLLTLLDFGSDTSANAGGNTFFVTQIGFDDERTTQSAPILVTGNTWTNLPPPGIGCSTCTPNATPPANCQIKNHGTCPTSGAPTGNVLLDYQNNK